MSWLLVAISAYLFLAIANLIDKFLIDNIITSSKAYTFIVCLMGGVVIIGAPWFLEWPGAFLFSLNILAGFIFSIALWLLYEALRRGEASRILVIIGGATPIFTAIFSLFFREQFSANQWMGIFVLLAGVFIIAFLPQPRSFCARVLRKLNIMQEHRTGGITIAIASALAYATFFWLSKYTYTEQPFASAFIWNRLGAALFVLLFLINAKGRKQIIGMLRKPTRGRHKFLVAFNQILGASGFLLQNYAIFLGPVVLVNALQGVQYAFLLVLSTVLAIMSPRLLKENFSWRIILQKLIAVALIALGLYFIII